MKAVDHHVHKFTKSAGSVKYFSMFSGVGGFELGIQRAMDNRGDASTSELATGDSPVSTVSDGDGGRSHATCIGYSEIDKYAIETYEHNWKGHTAYGDATTINERRLPDFDLLVGGFPCQAFSVAGKRLGFDETRGTLFFDIARILSHKRPQHLVLENVKGLLSHDSGKTFATIIGVLTDLGYVTEWQVLNAKDFGVPQNRERVFIVGHLGACCGRQIFPITGESTDDIVDSSEKKSSRSIAYTLDANYYKGVSPKGYQGSKRQLIQIVGGSQGMRVYDSKGVSSTIASQAGGLGAKTGLYAIPVLTPDRLEKRQNGRRMKNDGEPSFTLNTQYKHGIYDGARIRRLTPTECERLMSWPDGWTIGSDTQRYKQCGNGVVSNVVQAVISKLIKCLEVS